MSKLYFDEAKLSPIAGWAIDAKGLKIDFPVNV